MTSKYFLAIMLAAVMLFAACTPTSPGTGPADPTPVEEPTGPTSLQPLTSQAQLDSIFSRSGNAYYDDGFALRSTGAPQMAMAESADAPSMQGMDLDYSDTNVQVAGIDEADVIKTDGEFIYTVSGRQVFIIKAYPGEDARVLEDITFEDIHPSNLFIDGERLVVIGQVQRGWYEDRTFWYPQYRAQTAVLVYDVSDREDPVLEDELVFDGSVFQARLKDGVAYLAANTYSYSGTPELPVILRGGEEIRTSVNDVFIYPFPYDNPRMSTVYAVPIDDFDDVDSVSIVTEGSSQLYMSHDNIFLTSEQRTDEWRLRQEVTIDVGMELLSTDDRDLVERIRETDDDVLSEQEKHSKVLNLVNQELAKLSPEDQEQFEEEVKRAYQARIADIDYFEHTLVSRISYDDGILDVEADGRVPGSLNNQFSMDEHDGVLRMATTINGRWDWASEERTDSENHVYTLDEDLDVMDEVTGLAKTERIFSARFMEDRLYLVTFRQVDPFFVVDLSDPEDIEVVGELKIPGFSRYLHPYDDDVIIGLGRDADLEGRQQGLKISLFNVEDVTQPEEVASYKVSGKYSSSTAEFEHHAFLFSREKELLVIPVYQYDYQSKDRFNGVLVFSVEPDDIDLVGEVAHDSDRYRYQSAVERSLYIEDLLYTKSYDLLRIHELGTLDHVEDVDLDIEEQRYYPVSMEDGIAIEPAIR